MILSPMKIKYKIKQNVLINGELVKSNYTINSSETSALYLTRKGIGSLNITLKSISFCPQINAFEVYKMVDVPSDASSTTGCSPPCLSLQFMLFSNNYHFFHLLILLLNLNSSFSTTGYQQSTRLDLGWQDDPCLPSPWEKIECEGSLITSLYMQSIHFFSSLTCLQWGEVQHGFALHRLDTHE